MDKKQSLFEILGAGKAFAFGIVLSFLVIFSIGFFILLFSDGGFSLSNSKTDKTLSQFNQPVAADDQAANDQAAGQINIQPITSDDHINGDIQTAEVIVVEFSDLDCPYCKKFHPTMHQVLSDYGGKVAWVYRHFPLDSLHPQTRSKAEASECVTKLGGNDAFWSFIDAVYENESDDLTAFAQAAGVNVSNFNDCVSNKEFSSKVESQYQDAVTSGGRGTPYSIAISRDGKKVPINGALPLASVKAIIDPLLQ